LGSDTAIDLKVLRVSSEINAIQEMKHAGLFVGIGKLRDYKAKLHIDPEVRPVAQNPRRVPYGLRDKVEAEILNLQKQGIIEPVEGPTPWVSPLVIVPKPSGAVRLCVDMRRANEANIRERHPTPTVDEVLQDLNQSTVFSKLDCRLGFHQLELDEESRPITTFATHLGLFQYTRLFFGVNSAPELYQHDVRQVLQNCPGTANIADDIIVHGKTKAEHDERLQKVFQNIVEGRSYTEQRKMSVWNDPVGIHGALDIISWCWTYQEQGGGNQRGQGTMVCSRGQEFLGPRELLFRIYTKYGVSIRAT